MPHCKPPVDKRFSSTNQPKHRKPRGPSVVTALEQILAKKKSIEDVETGIKTKKPLAYIVAMRGVLNACEGDQNAIEWIADRTDGKVTQKVEQELSGQVTMMPCIKIGKKPFKADIS